MKPAFTVVFLWLALVTEYILELSITMIGIGVLLIIFLYCIHKNG